MLWLTTDTIRAAEHDPGSLDRPRVPPRLQHHPARPGHRHPPVAPMGAAALRRGSLPLALARPLRLSAVVQALGDERAVVAQRSDATRHAAGPGGKHRGVGSGMPGARDLSNRSYAVGLKTMRRTLSIMEPAGCGIMQPDVLLQFMTPPPVTIAAIRAHVWREPPETPIVGYDAAVCTTTMASEAVLQRHWNCSARNRIACSDIWRYERLTTAERNVHANCITAHH